MKMIKFLMLALVSTMFLTSCTENYSNGERIGMITKFSQKGLVYSSWEGSLNTTQTGMNSATPFEFSVDNDINDPKVISTLDSAATEGWKVKIKYHETWNKNWFNNRGETDYFVKDIQVLDRDPMGSVFGNKNINVGGRVVDTIYVVIVPKEKVIK
jgi:hypothetical protein